MIFCDKFNRVLRDILQLFAVNPGAKKADVRLLRIDIFRQHDTIPHIHQRRKTRSDRIQA